MAENNMFGAVLPWIMWNVGNCHVGWKGIVQARGIPSALLPTQ